MVWEVYLNEVVYIYMVRRENIHIEVIKQNKWNEMSISESGKLKITVLSIHVNVHCEII